MCSCCHLHTQFYCENGGGVYGRINIINNNLSIILWINRCNYHKYCLNYNFSYYFEQIITTRKRVVCSSPRRGFTCSPPKGGIEYLTLHYYYCCHLPVALSTYFSFLNGSIYSSIPI